MRDDRIWVTLFCLFVFLLTGVLATPPTISFIDPTPTGNISGNSIYVNLSSSDAGNHYSFVDFNNSLILWVRFDDANEDQVYDISSYAATGRLINNSNIGLGGVYNAKGNFDGDKDYLNFSDSSAFDSISVNKKMTFCLWMYPKATSGPYSTMIAPIGQWRTWNGVSAVNERSWGLLEGYNTVDGGYTLAISATGGSPYGTASTNGALALNAWHHVCGWYNGSLIKVYVNGVEQSSPGTYTSGIYNSPSPFTIGTYLFSTSGAGGLSDIYFNGSIDDVLIFNRDLSLAEIRAIYNSSFYRYQNNFTNLSNATYNVTAHAVNLNAERSSTSRLIGIGFETSNYSESALNISFVSPTPLINFSGNSIYVNTSTSGPDKRYSLVDFDSDLIFWMRMDNVNSSGQPIDLSSYGNNGTSYGGIINSSNGYFGNGSYFNGSSRIVIKNSSSLNFPGITDEITMCAWFKVYNHKTGYIGLVGKYKTNERQYLLCKNTTTDKYGLVLSPDGQSHTINGLEAFTDSALNTNQWYHLCGTFNGSTAQLYLDGAKQSASPTASGIYSSGTGDLEIGSFFQGTAYGFNGLIDDVLIYKRALSQQEVRAIYNSSLYNFENNYTNLSNNNYTFKAYSTDQYGNLSLVSRTLSLGNSSSDNPPQIVVNFPLNGASLGGYEVIFNLTVTDDNLLTNVSLWGNWTGSFILNETNSSGINGNYLFTKNFSEYGAGTYLWAVTAYDNQSQLNISSNMTFNIAIAENIPNITLGFLARQEKAPGEIFKVNLTTDNSADNCWFSYDGGQTNISMLSLGSQYFYYEDLTAGRYNITFYCENVYGSTTANQSCEFRRVLYREDQSYVNSQGLEIEFDFGYNYTAEISRAIIIPDSWTSEKDDTWVVQTENYYIGLGYIGVPVNTRGKGNSEGTKDAFGWECLDIYELALHLGSTSPYDSLIDDDKYYISGASGAGGKAGVCTAKYPDFFVAGFSSVGVLNLTAWLLWPSIPSGYYSGILERVGCHSTQCPEAYLARDASYLVYNTVTPVKAVANADDASVTINCSRNYNYSAQLYNKTVNYSEWPTGGHGTYRFSESPAWFENHTEKNVMPSSGELRVGGYVHTKNMSFSLNTVNYTANLSYDLSNDIKYFNITTFGFRGNATMELFDLIPNTNYTVDELDEEKSYISDSGGELSFNVTLLNYSIEQIIVSLALYCGDGSCNNGETCSSCSGDCGSCVSPPPVSPGGGGSSGGSVVLANKTTNCPNCKLEIQPVKAIVSIGEQKSITISVKNNGKVTANKCSLKGGGNYIDSNKITNIGVGEIVDFIFTLNVLDGEVENLDLAIECLDDIKGAVSLDIVILRPELDVSVDGISFDGDNLLISYSVEPEESVERILYFKVLNSFGGVVAEVSKSVNLVYGESYIGEVDIDMTGVDKGMLKLAISGENGISFVEEDFVYGGSSKATGFTLFDVGEEINYIGIAILLFVLLTGFLVWRIIKLKRIK